MATPKASERTTSTAVPAVLPLVQLRGDSARLFGGKAATLGVMLATGVPALEGVAVSADLYRQALSATGASELARRFWDLPWHSERRDGVHEQLSREIEHRLRESDRSELARAVLELMPQRRAVGAKLIVRSSATGEDSDDRSYAGQFLSTDCAWESDSLAHAIASVWASCTAPHVAAYCSALRSRDTHGLSAEKIDMGIIVQPYRHFLLAGVAFTQHPTVPVQGWLLLEYLDESPTRLVAGEVLPHRCRVSVRTGKIQWERHIVGRPVLSEEHLAELLKGVQDLRRIAGKDVDVEWGLLEDAMCFLQSRPTTTRPGSRQIRRPASAD